MRLLLFVLLCACGCSSYAVDDGPLLFRGGHPATDAGAGFPAMPDAGAQAGSGSLGGAPAAGSGGEAGEPQGGQPSAGASGEGGSPAGSAGAEPTSGSAGASGSAGLAGSSGNPAGGSPGGQGGSSSGASGTGVAIDYKLGCMAPKWGTPEATSYVATIPVGGEMTFPCGPYWYPRGEKNPNQFDSCVWLCKDPVLCAANQPGAYNDNGAWGSALCDCLQPNGYC
jgi:hypothetical protein